MPKTLPNNNSTPFHHNIFENHTETAKTQPRRPPALKTHGDVGKIRGILEMPPAEAREPAPFFKRSGARAVKTKTPRIPKTPTGRLKLVHSTVHFQPLVRADLEHLAGKKGLSFSQVVNDACEFYAEATLEEKYKASLKTELRQIIREELAAFGHRLIHFLRRIAFSAEHARLLITNVLKILLQRGGRYDEKHFHTLVDATAKTAKRNILRNTPQSKADLEDFWTSFTVEDPTAAATPGEKEAKP
jgi:hypothetical protein